MAVSGGGRDLGFVVDLVATGLGQIDDDSDTHEDERYEDGGTRSDARRFADGKGSAPVPWWQRMVTRGGR